ncbi:hypothetical protein TcasGA2_TC000013 [Tribolium castaneum]|uniref:Mab-21-like nucleotidyltransferase domain-containing protein n=1 Tax=Tribolium castaneum TaxID=7070 RepID=D7ELK1_TRICA|nr:hypothetical protein TcasGA2_TC000013 [Tribolium castaneum]
MSEESKKYKIIENVLQKINSMSIALPDDETKRNNQLLQIVKRTVQKIRDKSVLFNNLYQDISYVGSFYDGLKIGSPNEYDLDCNLRFPKLAEATIEENNTPGFVHVVLKNLDALRKSESEAAKYPNLDKLLDGNRLSTKKTKSWVESLIDTAFHGNLKMDVNIDGTNCPIKIDIIKSGPALTIKLEGVHNLKKFELKIDFVPCFIFPADQWPKNGYRRNLSHNKMLRKYGEYIKRRNIPNYWHEKHNLIEDLREETAVCIANKVRNIGDHIERICSSNSGFYDIVNYFLKPHEFDLDSFKQEVSVGKKLLKRMESDKNLAQVSSNSDDSETSDFAKLENLCLQLASDQRKVVGLLERLGEDLEKKKTQDERIMRRIESKIDRLLAKITVEDFETNVTSDTVELTR